MKGHWLFDIDTLQDEHDDVAESAVVPFPHAIKGEGIFAFVDLKETTHEKGAEIIADLRNAVKQSIASYAVPDYFLVSRLSNFPFASCLATLPLACALQITASGGLPKTRSGKIMRRILRKIACNQFDDLGDVSTLADPTVVVGLVQRFKDQIGQVKSEWISIVPVHFDLMTMFFTEFV